MQLQRTFFRFVCLCPAEIGEKRVETFPAEIIFIGTGRTEVEGGGASMTMVDGQDGLENIVFRDDVPSVGSGMVAGGCQCMGVGLEQGAQAGEEIRPIIADAEELEAFQTRLEKTHERRPCVVMIFHILSEAFENGGFGKRIVWMFPTELVPVAMAENEHQIAFEQLETRDG